MSVRERYDLENIPGGQDFQDLVWEKLATDGEILEREPDELAELGDVQAQITLNWLLRKHGFAIVRAFERPQAVAFENDVVVADELPESRLVRQFNSNIVHHVVGVTGHEADQAPTDRSLFVSTVMNGIAASDKYQRRIVAESQRPLIGSGAVSSLRLAAMRVEPSGLPEMVASIDPVLRNRDGEKVVVNSYHIESSLRDRNPGAMYVVDMVEGEQPQTSLKYWNKGGYRHAPFSDPAAEQRYFMAVFGDIASAFRNHDPADDAHARAAAQRGYLL